jgi:hypothetical protein
MLLFDSARLSVPTVWFHDTALTFGPPHSKLNYRHDTSRSHLRLLRWSYFSFSFLPSSDFVGW